VKTFSGLTEALECLLERLLADGRPSAPRGAQTLELTTTAFRLVSPRNRRCSNSARHWSYALAIGEFCWHRRGSNLLEEIAYYAPNWRRFSDDGRTIGGSCYGRRIFLKDERYGSQWENALAQLRNDPASRRAMLVFPSHDCLARIDTKDVPCAISFQLTIRDGALHGTTHMRSNDIMYGLPYDVFFFTMLQELASLELDIPLGHYTHMTESLHIYGDHVAWAKRILAEANISKDDAMAPMGPLQELNVFLEAEAAIREGRSSNGADRLSTYWSGLVNVLRKKAHQIGSMVQPRQSSG
jgi:thymidylate synthase